MSWSRIGYVTTNTPGDTYQKFDPQKIKPPSKPKRMESLQRSKSSKSLKIKLAVESRDSSRHESGNHNDLSYQRPSTPISKANTSMHIMPHIGALNLVGIEAERRMKRIKGKLELYVKDLREEIRILRSELWIKNQQFLQLKASISFNVQKLIATLNKQIISQKQELSDALSKISELTFENKKLVKKIEDLSRSRSVFEDTPIIQKKINTSIILETASSPHQHIRLNKSAIGDFSAYRMKGFNQIQNTINQLKQIFVDPFQI